MIRNQSGRSTAMGAADPRNRRAGQGLTAPDVLLVKPLYIDTKQRIAFQPAKALDDLTNPAASAVNTSEVTDTTGGTPDTTLVDVGALYDQAALNNNFASLAAQLEIQRTLNAVLVAAIATITTDLNDLKNRLRDGLLMQD